MKITVAGNKKEVEDGLTVAGLIELEQVETPQYVTVSVNEEFVESGAFESTVLKDGDEVEFLYFMGGGTILRSRIQDGSDDWPLSEARGHYLIEGGTI